MAYSSNNYYKILKYIKLDILFATDFKSFANAALFLAQLSQ
jgi:hypothetical protein